MELNKIVGELNRFDPVSILLYGSRARTDFLPESDYEIALFYLHGETVTWADIKRFVDEPGVNIYPFDYENFLKGTFDTPFQKSIYKRELIVSGKTIYGEDIQKLIPPKIQISDLIEDLRFNSGYALASLISLRNNDKKTSSLLFYKSCLFSARSPIMLGTGKFPYTYDDILKLSKEISLDEFQESIEKAYSIRKNKYFVEAKDVLKLITEINDFIEPILKEKYKENKDLVVVE